LPYARTALRVRSYRKETGKPGSWEIRYYLSSIEHDRRSAAQWIEIIRGHWGGVENRLHWRKDACLLEDETRSRNPNIVGTLMLIRNATMAIFAQQQPSQSLPAFTEAIAADSAKALDMLSRTF
jgi:hypothetical protein